MNLLRELWVEAFTHRLLNTCPRIGRPDAENVAEALLRDGASWSDLHPMRAADRWLGSVLRISRG
jgi:hypothetical protein